MKESRTYSAFTYPSSGDTSLRARIEQLRYRGHRGGIILKHRALLTSVRTSSKAFQSFLLVVLVLVVWFSSFNSVSLMWARILDFWRDALGLGGYVVMLHYPVMNLFRLDVPYFPISAGGPSFLTWWAGALGTLVLVMSTFLMPYRWVPIVYLLRIVAFFQACAQIFFAFVPLEFPYAATGYVHGMFIGALAFLSLMPFVLAFTFYILDISFIKKFALTLLIMVHLCLLIPFQYMAHAFVLYNYSLLFLPLLFFIFGLPLNVLIFIAFYSWGASWKNLYDRKIYLLAPDGREPRKD
jgi:hypothetical protein